jgi:hypothetical protein
MKISKTLFTILTLLTLVSCGKDADQILEQINDQIRIEDEIVTPVELIVNGSFEEGHGLGNNKWNVFSELPGWKADLAAIDAPIEIQNGDNIGGMPASDGTAKLELDSHNKNGFTRSDAHVYQEVQTTSGAKYKLKVDYSPRVNNCNNSCVVEVYWDETLVATLDDPVKGWKSYEFELDGTGETSRLEFRAYEDNNTTGGYIDNVSMKIIVGL